MKYYIQSAVTLFAIVFLAFVFLGDRFLPEPLGPASEKTRVTLNKFLVGLIPNWEPKTNPYQRTEEALEQEKQGGNSQ